jgi:phosphatidylinositol alpha-1,6-mannosyltransferase
VITAFAKDRSAERVNVLRPATPGLLPFLIFALRRGARLLKTYPNIKVIVGGSVLMTPVVFLLARRFRRRAVILAHGLDLIYPSAVYQALIVRWLSRVDRVIANSRHTATLACAKGVSAERIAVIPPGVDYGRFVIGNSSADLKRERGLENKKVILFVGRLAPRKGVKEFVEFCLPGIAHTVPQVVFAIAGDNPSESLVHRSDVASAIRAAVTRLNLSEHVRWFGAVRDEELVNLYTLCDVLVLPARELRGDVEGFGMVALEAAAAGKPVVATRVGGISDAVADGLGGILVEPEDHAGLSRAVVSLLNDAERANSMGEAGRRRALAEFDWRAITARYEAELGRLSGAPSKGVD